MIQKKLYRTLETVASKSFASEKELLVEILQQIVANEQVNVTGGRLWKLDLNVKGYKLIFQTGNVPKIKWDFVLKLKDYPIFNEITRQRTILANETNEELRKKGIFKYSASGVATKIKYNDQSYYEYLIAFNSDSVGDELRYTLNIVATLLTSKISERRISASRKYLIADLDKAKELQKSILPEHEYTFQNYEIFGVTLPAEILGGDYFDYLQIGNDEERLGITVGDAASKGISAAAEAMYISGAIRMASTFQMKISPMMFRLNNLINKIFSDDRFTTLFYGEISNDKKGLFLYANAGHNPPIFYSSAAKSISFLEPTGPLLGPAPNSKYETDSINFSAGDLLVIFTDGIVEAANEKFEFYGEQKLMELIKKNSQLSPKEICYLVIESVNKFATVNSKYQDDKTVVVIKRKR
ncbi:MAG: serine/threonine-protein phosphatase [Bacteroidetes bacterium]|nr:serine/threonine-protein phosphatase [Bacteroidota bacterium]MBU1677462.1 serine/threonine-protein phosphatase [Bacteroidota bacterium]MBU2505280.1 serine/threonine-protein phosphatase [Bacteroidota bacterium]